MSSQPPVDLPPGFEVLFGSGVNFSSSAPCEEDEYEEIILRFGSKESREKAAKRIVGTGLLKVRIRRDEA